MSVFNVRYESLEGRILLEFDTNDVTGILAASNEVLEFQDSGTWKYVKHLLSFYYERGILKQRLTIYLIPS
ncbi:hypothetical protein ACFYKX_25380 [Cytobacillus sp. FJAT-54145]|uniref:KTSC domain-containing protein n=1 Tax=Cytobacillus spartinae TaxID=3299023 RepID=A0ABW6KM45_9BACI